MFESTSTSMKVSSKVDDRVNKEMYIDSASYAPSETAWNTSAFRFDMVNQQQPALPPSPFRTVTLSLSRDKMEINSPTSDRIEDSFWRNEVDVNLEFNQEERHQMKNPSVRKFPKNLDKMFEKCASPISAKETDFKSIQSRNRQFIPNAEMQNTEILARKFWDRKPPIPNLLTGNSQLATDKTFILLRTPEPKTAETITCNCMAKRKLTEKDLLNIMREKKRSKRDGAASLASTATDSKTQASQVRSGSTSTNPILPARLNGTSLASRAMLSPA